MVEPKLEKTSWKQLQIHQYIKILVIGILFFIFYYNQIYHSLLHKWISDPSWSHGFIIPLFSLYFLNQKKKEILSVKPQTNYWGYLIIILSFVFYALNVIQIKIGTLYIALIIPTLLGIVLFLCGWQMIKYTWLPIVFLFFAIPIPDRLYKAITIPMRIWASSISSALLNLVPNIDAASNGVVIDIVYKGVPLEPSLDVAEACSGMRLLMAFVALGVAMAYLHKRHWIQRIVLLISTVPIAILCNIVRVTITAFIYVLIDPKYAQGIYHDMLGMAMLPMAFFFYGALAWFMSSLFVEETQEAVKEDVIIIRKAEGENG